MSEANGDSSINVKELSRHVRGFRRGLPVIDNKRDNIPAKIRVSRSDGEISFVILTGKEQSEKYPIEPKDVVEKIVGSNLPGQHYS